MPNIEDIEVTEREALLVYLAVSQTTKRMLALFDHAQQIMVQHPNNKKAERAAEYKWQRSLTELQYRLKDEIKHDWYTLEDARLGMEFNPRFHRK